MVEGSIINTVINRLRTILERFIYLFPLVLYLVDLGKEFCTVVEFHQRGSKTNRATPSSFNELIMNVSIIFFFLHFWPYLAFRSYARNITNMGGPKTHLSLQIFFFSPADPNTKVEVGPNHTAGP